MHIQPDRALIPSGAPSVRYLHITITAPAAPAREEAMPRIPTDVALVLDRSGSMEGRKFDSARRAVTHAVRLLGPSDRFALVCYDDQVTTVVEGTAASGEAKTLALRRLEAIEPRGATNLAGGWQRGAELTPPREEGESRRKVLLLTDGLANNGIVDPDELAAIAQRLRALGLATSTFGVGADFDERLLARLATEGGGHFYFIEHPRQIPDLFASELGDTLDIVARDAVLEIACDPGVEAAVVNDLPTSFEGQRLHVRLGDLAAECRNSRWWWPWRSSRRRRRARGWACGAGLAIVTARCGRNRWR